MPDIPRPRGRPRGGKKYGGRQKGTPNKFLSDKEVRAALMRKSDAIGVLADVAQGKQYLTSGPTAKPIWKYPSMSERLVALRIIMDRCVPTLTATTLSGPDDKPLFQTEVFQDNRQISRAILQILASGVDSSNGELIFLPTGGNASAMPPLSADGDAGRASPAAAAPGGPAVQDSIGPPINSAASPDGWRSNSDTTPIGTVEEIGDAGHHIELRERDNSGREKYFIFDDCSRHVAAAWGREEAERACQELIDTGRISR